MHWIYISPHLDDAVFSCGGLIGQQARAGEKVEIWTLCAGDPPPDPLSPFARSLHNRWQTSQEAVAHRRREDQRACARLGVAFRHFPLPDCIYRRHPDNGAPLYASEEAIFGPVHPAETSRIRQFARKMRAQLPTGARIVAPLGVGDHVDHRFACALVDHLWTSDRDQLAGGPDPEFWRYADYPYVVRRPDRIRRHIPDGFRPLTHSLTEPDLLAWVDAAACYQSQLSTFWSSHEDMETAIRAYASQHSGVRLWRRVDG